MDDSDINGIFKDFEQKVNVKKEAPKNEKGRLLSEEDELGERYKKAEQALKEKYKKEKEALWEKNAAEEKRPEVDLRPHHVLLKGISNYERLGYIAVITILVAYIGLGFFQGSDAGQEQTVTAAAVKTEEPAEEQETETAAEEIEEEKQNETPEETAEEKALSGKIIFTLDEVDAEVIDADNDLGKIEKVVFSIENGKDKDLTPVVVVYAYDSEMDDSWETISRGQYKGDVIKPGDEFTGSINLVPKTFKNLNIQKSIRLALNDTEEGFITAVNEKVLIE